MSYSVCESSLPLNSVPALYSAVSSRTSYHSRSPSVASSRESSHARSRSSVSRSHHSQSRSRSCTHRSLSAGVVSTWAGLWEESPLRSRSSRFPSRTSSGCGSASDGSRCRSHSRSRSPSRCMEEKCRRSSFHWTLFWLWPRCGLNELLEAPSESRKIHRFCVALEDNDQSASSYYLPVGGASGDILSDIDDCISSPSSGMLSKKVSKLLTYPGVHSRRFNRFEG